MSRKRTGTDPKVGPDHDTRRQSSAAGTLYRACDGVAESIGRNVQ